LIRKAKITDSILPKLTEQQLERLGLVLGEIVAFKEEIAALAVPLLTSQPLEAPRSLESSNFKQEHALKEAPELQDAHVKSKAVAVPSHHLPSVPMASLPPLTHACGEPGASGSVFKIEYQGKPAAAKR
jgi:hypothetical protein